ncbi:Hypothetical predicted protein [Mytilus galloprovincialis]|uniref:SMB domain-containing protein n=2 Tax=Mytilus galloprovincialis TaxID=29158 RepID=A0A8B6H1H4_MYTGA|nr:Hypothetical predicted protein [Mytilus galloprovincialis]
METLGTKPVIKHIYYRYIMCERSFILQVCLALIMSTIVARLPNHANGALCTDVCCYGQNDTCQYCNGTGSADCCMCDQYCITAGDCCPDFVLDLCSNNTHSK